MTVRSPDSATSKSEPSEFEFVAYRFLVSSPGTERISNPIFRLAKRILDLSCAILALMVLSPVLLILAIFIKLDSSGGVFYRQLRIGKGGKPFEICKFRSMYPSADDMLEALIQEDPSQRVSWQQYQKLLDDPRLTPLGRIMRRLSIDELPQIWNVIKGEMSLVGPRPFLPEQKIHYGEAYHSYIQVRPGITGLWQINGRNLTSFKDRARWDEYYVRNWSFLLDLYILIATVGVVIRGEGAY